ncbi:hypothetical protein [Sulfitobacter sp. S190]|uniref:hypothetical protein n=1 Tax=Sulfitobacter sp. S190 TaxID=2867022 RepID=UPI0021A6BA04|nr:hypothetical protein [Sulfitobacter sp. S190]UWR21114.1 hypothetical protein K3756_10305 [Sulfitobacter sp. S190]
MRKPVCPGDIKANSPEAEDIAIGPEEMKQAIQLGIVPDELIEAGRPYVTHAEMDLYGMKDEANFMSLGLTAWRAIAFALEKDLALPNWVCQYLRNVAEGIDHWAILNEHPSALKDVLGLHGTRKYEQENETSDPRWIFATISRMKENDPSKSVTDLCGEYLKQYPKLSYSDEAIRQKYYEGRKLAETGEDYKGRGRKKEIQTTPMVGVERDEPDIDF